uniref:Ubiquitin-like domain-containing protein n=1 Tax=Panagrolaimus sp. PS1159 TaxID=55785 RepID=A0AC35FM03_9BILA
MGKEDIIENDQINLKLILINLKLILVSGRTREFQFAPSTSAAEVCQHVFDNWPLDWEEEQVASASLLKLIYHGRFLHGSVTLNALSLPVGKTTVMHLVTRENLPEPNSSDSIKKAKRSSCCRCCIC